MNRLARPGVALGAAFLILIVITCIVGSRLAIQSHSALSCLVEDHLSGGGSGLRTWAENLGFATLPLRPPIQQVASELPNSGHCLITAGNNPWNGREERFADDEWSQLSKWIRLGNTLIVMTSNNSSLPTPVEQHFTMHVPNAETTNETNPEFEWHDSDPLSMKEVRQELVKTWWGGELSVDASGPRLKNLPPHLLLAGRGNAAVLAAKPLGEGMIYLLLDPEAWTNRGFDRADNAASLARILKRHLEPDGVLAFDEYRHGRGRVESFTTSFLSLPGAKSFFWMAMTWTVFWFWSSTRRLSPPDEYQEIERRTAMEYIESVASMNQRARAAPLTVKAVVARVRYLLQKRGTDDLNVDPILNRAVQHVALAERPAFPKKEIEIVSELIQLRRSLYGTRHDPRAD